MINYTEYLTICFEVREQRVLQEKDLLQKQSEWLTSELRTKTEELLSSSRERSQESLQLHTSLDLSQEQVPSTSTALTWYCPQLVLASASTALS